MKEAGIGGVEINPIAFPAGSDPAGYEPLTIFEEKWMDMLQVALEGAKGEPGTPKAHKSRIKYRSEIRKRIPRTSKT